MISLQCKKVIIRILLLLIFCCDTWCRKMAALNILDVFSIMNKVYGVPGPENCINIDDNDCYRHNESECEFESSSSEDDERACQQYY